MLMRRANLSAPKVMFVATDLSTGGGVNKVIRDLTVLFRQRFGFDVTVVNARSDLQSAYAFPDDVPVQRHRRQSLLSYFARLISLRRSRPDFVISSWAQDNVLVALAFAGSSSKVVLIEHASWHFHGPAIRMLRRIIYPLASRLVVLNRNDLAYYRRYLSRVRLIPNPVTEKPAAAVRREKLIIAIGHLEPVKNFEDAIRAMAASRLEDEGWSLAIIGSGSCEGRLRELIGELGLRRTEIRHPKADLGPWYARASLILVPSRSESFSLVLAEAMLSGVLPIAYASDGPSFLLEEFPDHLVELGNVGALSESLARIARKSESETLRRQMSSSIEERFSPEEVARQWQELLETCDATKPC
jgi:glycosyltransferase involved in cell wall biosynthesis